MAQYIYGRNVVVSRLKEAKDIEEVFLLDSFKDKYITDLLEKSKVKLIRCKKSKLDSLAGNEFHQGIVAKVHTYDYYDFEALMDGVREADPVRALINPNKLKQDYDDKIISIGFEHDFQPGDIFEWCNTGTYWLIYL
jgi:tRNA G18 (ribose-2'-O)-methylase SpoU